MEFRSLRIIDRFHWLFSRLGVDYPTMRKILELKLTMDARRIPTALQNNKKGKFHDEQSNQMLRSLWMYALFSLMPGIVSFIPVPLFSKVTLIMGISMFLIMSTMISDFSSVLLDIRDKNVIMAFPVNDRTISAAKAVHISIYLFLITLSLNLLSIIGIGVSEGIGIALLLMVMLIFMVMMVIFLTSLMYVLVLKNFDGEKLKDLISSIQIMLTIVMTLGYQVIARMFEFSEIHVAFTPKWWTVLLPPTWFAAPFALISGETNSFYILLSLLGLLLPLVCIFMHFKVITPAFEDSLVKLNTSEKSASKAYFRRRAKGRFLSKLLCRSAEEQATFQFGYSVLSTERELKQKIYPSIAMAVVFPFILGITLIEDKGSIANALEAFRHSNQFLWIYFSVMILPSVFLFVGNSKYYKGAWLYRSVPLDSPFTLLSGTYKSAILKFGIPPFLFTSVIMVALAGWGVLVHMGIAFFNTLYMVLFLIRINGAKLPFSRSFQVSQDGHMKGSFLSLAVTGVLGGLHILLVHFGNIYFAYGMLAVQVLAISPFWKSTLKISWDNI